MILITMTEFIKNRRIIVVILVTAIIATIIIGGLLYLREVKNWYELRVAAHEAKEKADELRGGEIADEFAELTPSEVGGWKTYRNEKYGFEVRYPEDFTGSRHGMDEMLFTAKEVFKNSMTVFYGQKPEPRELLIWSIDITREAGLDSFCKYFVNSSGYNKKNFSLNGIEAVRCDNTNLYNS